MSWLGGSLSSLTGQLTNLTKDILTEGTEETSDQGTELRIAQEKIQDGQNVIAALNSENERLKQLNHDLEEKAESSELQINTISNQYRHLLEEKQGEIKKLKEDQHELLLHHSTTEYSPERTEYGGYSPANGTIDDLDFGDTIGLQHEINNLRKENRTLQSKCDQLKALSKTGTSISADDKYQKEIDDLQRELKDVSQQLATEKENHQQEVASLQDVHSQKASVLRKKFKDEITQYKHKISELEENLAGSTSNNGSESQTTEYLQLERTLKSLEHDQTQLKHDYDLVCKELKHAKNQLLDQLDSNHEKELKSEINELESEQDRVFSEADSMVTNLGSQQQQELTSAVFDNLEKENTLLQKNNLELQEQIVLLERSFQSLTEEKLCYNQMKTDSGQNDEEEDLIKADIEAEKEALEEVLMDLRGQLKVKDTDLSDVSDKMRKQEDQIQWLKKEKKELEKSLNKSKLEMEQEKEKVQQLVTDSKEDQEEQRIEDQLVQKSRLLEELSTEKNELETSLIELDAQHEEEMNQVIKIRNELSGKLDDMRAKVQELTELKDQLLQQHQSQEEEKEELTNKMSHLKEQVQNQKSEIEKLSCSNQAFLDEVEKIKSEKQHSVEQDMQGLKAELEEKEKTLTNLQEEITIKTQENGNLVNMMEENNQQLKTQISSNETLTTERNQLVQDLENKEKFIISLEKRIQDKDEAVSNLEEKYQYVSEKLQQGSQTEVSEYLQKINHLQENLSEKEQALGKIETQLQADTDSVKKLQQEREVITTQYEDMKEKFNNGAMTINNLHMDVQELKEKLTHSESELNNKVQKIKMLRDENDQYKQTEFETDNEPYRQRLENNVSEKQQLTDEILSLKSDLQSKTQQLNTLTEKYTALVNSEKDISEQKDVSEKQISELQSLLEEQEEEINNYKQEISIQKIELCDKMEFLLTENLSLENKVKQAEKALDEKSDYYENLLKEIENGNDKDAFTSEENRRLLQLNKENETTIKSLTDEIDALKKMINEAEGLTDSKSVDFIASEQTFNDLQRDLMSLSAENEVCQSKINEQKEIICTLEKNEKKLKLDVETLQSRIEVLTTEQTVASQTIAELQDEIHDHKSGIIQLNDRCQDHAQSLRQKESEVTKQEGILAVLRQVSLEKDQEILNLNKRMKRALSLISHDQHKLLDTEIIPDYSLPALEYPEKGSIEHREKQEVHEEMVMGIASQQQSGRDVIGEMEQLQSLIKQKDDVISELQTNNVSLLKSIENKSLSTNDKAVVDIHRLENEVRNLKIEREQIMAVMNEKSREASSLKSEVHRLMNVVAAEKSAIDKLQKDMVQGSAPQGSAPAENDDMQREALQNLSRLVRDKDLEVEALKQKNETLLAVLQDSSSNGSELSTMMQDKDNLTKQLKVLQDEREQMVVFVNQKHEESLKYHQEVQRLTEYINTELEKHSQIQQEYDQLAPQFEDKKQALLKAQNELINYKQKYTELEVKYGEMVQRVNSSDTIDISTHNTQTEELKHTREKLKELNDSLRETEQKVTALHQQNVEYEEELAKRDTEVHSMKKQIDILTFQLHGAQGQLTDLKQEHSQSEKESSEHVSHSQMLKESNNRLTLELQDRDFEIKSLKEKLQTLTSVVDGQRDEEGQVNKLLQENESVMSQVKELQQERHQTLMALKQRQIETQELQRECQKAKDKELKYEKELERLRGHLIQMEEAYTRDALESEEREKDLRNRLAIAEEKVLSSSTAIQSASQQAVNHVDSLQQQLHQVASQRDQAYLQLSSLQDQVQQYAVSLSNLQLVLEQFQRDKDGQVATEIEKYQRENVKLKQSVTDLNTELKDVKEKLEEAEDGLQAAVRLHQQLDRCDQIIAALKEEVQIREAALKNAEVEISDLRNSKDARVDKLVIKSMFLGYFTAPKNKQDDVLHTIGSVLNFSPEEFDKVLGKRGGWMTGWLGFGGSPATPPTTPTRRHTVSSADKPDKSFSELFVKFLETESTPTHPLKLPAEEMAKDVQRHHKPVFNPFTAPRHVTDGTSREDKHLLMPSSPLASTFPVFSQVTDLKQPKTSSSAILNDVLKSS